MLKGSYSCNLLPDQIDIWPGDGLDIMSQKDEASLNALVRQVIITFNSSLPEMSTYSVRIANDGAEAICIKLSSGMPDDLILPIQQNIQVNALASLSSLDASQITASTLTISTGVQAPLGGGFEVRRKDQNFGSIATSDLVLRTSATSISIPRVSAVEEYYVRMYDNSKPPNYSAFSAAVFLNVPV